MRWTFRFHTVRGVSYWLRKFFCFQEASNAMELGVTLWLHHVSWVLALTLQNSAPPPLSPPLLHKIEVKFHTLSSAILNACISSLLLPRESRPCWPNLCPSSLHISCNYCCRLSYIAAMTARLRIWPASTSGLLRKNCTLTGSGQLIENVL
jgi:hypothetical protein